MRVFGYRGGLKERKSSKSNEADVETWVVGINDHAVGHGPKGGGLSSIHRTSQPEESLRLRFGQTNEAMHCLQDSSQPFSQVGCCREIFQDMLDAHPVIGGAGVQAGWSKRGSTRPIVGQSWALTGSIGSEVLVSALWRRELLELAFIGNAGHTESN